MNAQLKRMIRSLLPRTIRKHQIMGGSIRGSVIVTSWHDYPAAILGRTERPLLEHFAKNAGKGETWLDIGAHYGYTAIALSKLVDTSGRVFAFEPMMNTAGCISRTRLLNQLPQLTVIPIGLANGADLAVESLYTSRGMIDSTLENTEGFKETFLVSRLDWLWPQISGSDPRIHGVKIDVQGMEIQVIEGMAGLLRQYRPKLFVEVHKGVSRPKLLDLIASLGYSRSGTAVEPLHGETAPAYADDRTYLFTPVSVGAS
jgi:FkbM family methyltransferase